MRLAMGIAAVAATAASAHGDVRYASVHVNSIVSGVPQAISASGEGSSIVGLSGSVGPVVGGAPTAFSLTFDLGFDSFSVPGDGFVSNLSLHPSFASGALQVTGFSLTTELFAGAASVSQLSGVGTTPASLSSGGTTTLSNFALAYGAPGASQFSFIGDHGTISATLDFAWTGSDAGDTLSIDVMPGSHFAYAFAIPTPGGACVMGLGALSILRRRRGH